MPKLDFCMEEMAMILRNGCIMACLGFAVLVAGCAASCQEPSAASHPPIASIRDAIRTINEIFIRPSP